MYLYKPLWIDIMPSKIKKAYRVTRGDDGLNEKLTEYIKRKKAELGWKDKPEGPPPITMDDFVRMQIKEIPGRPNASLDAALTIKSILDIPEFTTGFVELTDAEYQATQQNRLGNLLDEFNMAIDDHLSCVAIMGPQSVNLSDELEEYIDVKSKELKGRVDASLDAALAIQEGLKKKPVEIQLNTTQFEAIKGGRLGDLLHKNQLLLFTPGWDKNTCWRHIRQAISNPNSRDYRSPLMALETILKQEKPFADFLLRTWDNLNTNEYFREYLTDLGASIPRKGVAKHVQDRFRELKQPVASAAPSESPERQSGGFFQLFSSMKEKIFHQRNANTEEGATESSHLRDKHTKK